MEKRSLCFGETVFYVRKSTQNIGLNVKPVGGSTRLTVRYGSIIPVSYTHLDVYKRQELYMYVRARARTKMKVVYKNNYSLFQVP